MKVGKKIDAWFDNLGRRLAGLDAGPITSEVDHLKPGELLRAYRHVVDLENKAIGLTLALDRHIESQRTGSSSAKSRVTFLKTERALFEAERPIDDGIQALYRMGVGLGERDTDQVLIRTALLH